MLYLIAIILIIGWALGWFAFGAGEIIHLLLVVALFFILAGLIKDKIV